MLPFWLNVAGLILGMKGVAVLFFFGWPQAFFPPEGRRLIAGDGPPDPKLVRSEKRHQRAAAIGLLLVLLGMALQLVAVIVQGLPKA
jgi:hypothetical protein